VPRSLNRNARLPVDACFHSITKELSAMLIRGAPEAAPWKLAVTVAIKALQ